MASTLSLTRCTARGGGTRARSTALPSPLDHARSPPHQVRDAPPRPATVARRMQHPRDARAQRAVRDHVRRRAALPEPARPPEPAPAHVRLRAPAHAVPCAGGGGRRAGRSRSTSSTRATACAAAPPAPTERARPPETALAHIPPAWARPPSSPVYCRLSWRRVGIVSVFSATESEWYSE